MHVEEMRLRNPRRAVYAKGEHTNHALTPSNGDSQGEFG
jgi:hypothetical protein